MTGGSVGVYENTNTSAGGGWERFLSSGFSVLQRVDHDHSDQGEKMKG